MTEENTSKTNEQRAILDSFAELWASCEGVTDKLSAVEQVSDSAIQNLREQLGWSGAGAGVIRERLDTDEVLAGRQFDELNEEIGWIDMVREVTICLTTVAAPAMATDDRLVIELEVINNAADLLMERMEEYFSKY
jgi:hypothetical protein